MQYSFHTADVFTSQPFNGAQITVFPDASGLSDDKMQQIANEMSVSETVFVFPNGEDRKRQLRIFSPQREVSFGSHTTLAAAHVLTSTGALPFKEDIEAYTFQHAVGDVNVHVTNTESKPSFVQFSMTVKPKVDLMVPTRDDLAAILSINPAEIETDPFLTRVVSCDEPYLIVPLKNAQTVKEAVFNAAAWNSNASGIIWTENVLLYARQQWGEEGDFYARLVGPRINPADEPPVGASIPAFAGYLASFDHVRKGTYTFSVARGAESNRRSILHVEIDNKGEESLTLRVGGPAVLMSSGSINVVETH